MSVSCGGGTGRRPRHCARAISRTERHVRQWRAFDIGGHGHQGGEAHNDGMARQYPQRSQGGNAQIMARRDSNGAMERSAVVRACSAHHAHDVIDGVLDSSRKRVESLQLRLEGTVGEGANTRSIPGCSCWLAPRWYISAPSSAMSLACPPTAGSPASQH